MRSPDLIFWRFSLGPIWRMCFWLGFYAAILLAWLLLMQMTASPIPGMTAAEYWSAICISANQTGLLTLFAMWAIMSAAMMLPTFVPALRVFGELGSVKASTSLSMAALVSGYASLWLIFSAFAAALQLGLAEAGAMNTAGQSLAPWSAAGLLFLAGAYQFSNTKHACLSKCRHPLTFFMQHWSPGLTPAFTMGLRLGIWCVGCCWLLMILALVGGAMNLLWMGVATFIMVIEKLPEIGRYITYPLGIGLMMAGLFQLYTIWGG